MRFVVKLLFGFRSGQSVKRISLLVDRTGTLCYNDAQSATRQGICALQTVSFLMAVLRLTLRLHDIN